MDIMAITQDEAAIAGSIRRPRRTKQRSLTKILFKPFGTDDDASGKTAPLSSEFADSSHPTLKSCLKHNTSLLYIPDSEKSVRFDSVEVREHEMILGDNPSVTSGPPLTLAWESHATYTCTVDDYETSHPARRNKANMLVPRRLREDWLRNAGYARSDFMEAERVLNKIKRSRATTAAQQDSVLRKFWKAVR